MPKRTHTRTYVKTIMLDIFSHNATEVKQELVRRGYMDKISIVAVHKHIQTVLLELLKDASRNYAPPPTPPPPYATLQPPQNTT